MTDDSFCRLKPPFSGKTILWEITDTCNLTCRHCINSSSHYSSSSWKQEIGQLSRHKPCRVVITGGEPLLHPELEEMIFHLKEKGCEIVVLTNGTLITPNRVKSLQGAGVESLTISIHSHIAKVQDKLSQRRGAFERILEGIAISKSQGISFSISTVVLPENVNSIGELIDFAFQLTAKSISINSFLPYPNAPDDLIRWIKNWDPRPVGDIVRSKRKLYGPGRIKTSGLLPCQKDLICPANKFFLGISSHGDWHPCLPAEELSLSNLLKEKEYRGYCPLLVNTRSSELYRIP